MSYVWSKNLQILADVRYLMNSPLNREILISRFQDIETNTPVRKEKLRKLDELYQSIKDNSQLTWEEVLGLIKALLENGVTIRQTFFSDVIHPVLSHKIDQEDVEAIKLMIKLEQQLIVYQGINKESRYSAIELINKGLELSPDDRELLQMYEVKTANYLSYTIHEVPIGIIYGPNGATIEQCDELLELVNEYEQACKKLGIDRCELVNDCRHFYTLYMEYLKVYSNYDGFKDYLASNKHRIT